MTDKLSKAPALPGPTINQILLRRTKNNPVLIGDPGVGKTAVAEGLAQLLAGLRPASSGLHIALPPGLQGRRMVALDVGSLVAGTQYRGALEERLQVGLRGWYHIRGASRPCPVAIATFLCICAGVGAWMRWHQLEQERGCWALGLFMHSLGLW